MALSIGDRVRVNNTNDYDTGAGYDPAASFTELEGTVVQVGKAHADWPPIYHVELESAEFHKHVSEDNPWPFYETELDRV